MKLLPWKKYILTMERRNVTLSDFTVTSQTERVGTLQKKVSMYFFSGLVA